MIYFIGDGEGPVKIGVSYNPFIRLAAFQYWSPADLRILAMVRGSALQEKKLHAHFAAHHIRGEWFQFTPEVIDVVECLRTTGLWPDVIKAAFRRKLTKNRAFRKTDGRSLRKIQVLLAKRGEVPAGAQVVA